MPNGTRRGHVVHRGGRTFWRGPSRIATPKVTASVAIFGGAALLALGVPQVVVGGLAVAGVVTFLGMRSPRVRRWARQLGKRAERWATRRAVKAGRQKPAPPPSVRPSGATPAPPYRRPGSAVPTRQRRAA